MVPYVACRLLHLAGVPRHPEQQAPRLEIWRDEKSQVRVGVLVGADHRPRDRHTDSGQAVDGLLVAATLCLLLQDYRLQALGDEAAAAARGWDEDEDPEAFAALEDDAARAPVAVAAAAAFGVVVVRAVGSDQLAGPAMVLRLGDKAEDEDEVVARWPAD